MKGKNTFMKRYLLPVIIFGILFFLSERSLCKPPDCQGDNIDIGKMYSSNADTITYSNKGVLINNMDATDILFDLNNETQTIKFISSSERVIEGTIYMRDEGMKYYWQFARQFYLNAGENKETVWDLKSQGKCKSVLIALDDNDTNFALHEVSINDKKTFNWNRFIVGVCCFILFVIVINNHNIIVNYGSRRVRHILLSIAIVLTACSLGVWGGCTRGNVDNIDYSEKNLTSNIYLYMFDSFQKNICYLDINIDATMNKLENIYDRSERDFLDVKYMWDYAYKDGKYYSYYGVTPVFLIYEPYYLITGKLPNNYMVGLILSIATNLMLLLLVYHILARYKIKCTVVTLAMGIIAVSFGSLIYSLQSCANNLYNLNMCTCFCMLLCIYFVMKASSNHKYYYLYWIIAAISIVLLIECRPNAIIPVIGLTAPICIKYIKDNIMANRKKLMISIGAFMTVLMIGAIAIGYYNWARFGSIIDFGKDYQLTAYDSNYFTFSLDIRKIIGTIYYYIFEIPLYKKNFPFVELNNTPVSGLGHYNLKDPNLGIICLPILWILVIGAHAKSRFSKNDQWIFLGGVIGSIICMYLDFNFGGAQIRYHSDYLIILLLIAFVMMIKIEELYCLNDKADTMFCSFQSVARLLCIMTIIIGTLLIFSNQLNVIRNNNPDWYCTLYSIFTL